MYNYNNILITGGCGFIGSNFINYIFDKTSCNIINIDKISYCSNEKNILEDIIKSDRYYLYKINIINKENILQILNKHNIDCVVHFAAQTHVSNSFNNFNEFIEDNIIVTHNLLEVCKIYSKLKLFIHISTDEVYGESNLDTNLKKNETTLLNPTNPYAATKASCEMIVNSFIYSYKLPIIIVRCNNIFGKNQYIEKVIPKFIYQLKNNNKITIEGNGTQKRTFLHVEDFCEALILISNKGKIGEIYNIGNNDNELTIKNLAIYIIKKIKKTDNYEQYIINIQDRIYNDTRYYIDYNKLKLLGWTPKKDLFDSLNVIIDYEISQK